MSEEDAPAPVTILLVEDDEVIRRSVTLALERYGYRVVAAGDGLTGLELFREGRHDLLLLDVMLPGLDGIGLCRRIRETSMDPVLMMSARGDALDVVSGLEAGADDYVVKPFGPRELVARVQAGLRRSAGDADEPTVRVDGLEVDLAARRVRVDGAEVHLTPTEFDLLVRLARSPRTVLTRERLLADVWDWADASGTRTVDSHVKALRRKLGPGLIRTVHGVGYSAEPDDADATDVSGDIEDDGVDEDEVDEVDGDVDSVDGVDRADDGSGTGR